MSHRFPLLAQPACYEPHAVEILERLIDLSLDHPTDPHAITGHELRRMSLPCRSVGYPTDLVDDWLDQQADRLEQAVKEAGQ
ncbi:cell division protein DivIVA [Bifidobacterium felsineum]|uniref:cell division protein DivIVA n=1 Tax=Bifidobacterium felsineum TaxID=2045440 RepID=UPI001BDD63AD|nr:cell division protein DivIVA [Bifidobacterium felsineum]MBT1164588.1 cell division protein DivIVA [Bifidobacterium felsineum]